MVLGYSVQALFTALQHQDSEGVPYIRSEQLHELSHVLEKVNPVPCTPLFDQCASRFEP
jgi:hypothetical protein